MDWSLEPRTSTGPEGPGEPPNREILKLHDRLRKAESSMLVQARTEKIGLVSFLKRMNVLGITSGNCRCGSGEETVKHVVLYCSLEDHRRDELRSVDNQLDYQQLTYTAEGARRLSRWLIFSGRLPQFSLARTLLYSYKCPSWRQMGYYRRRVDRQKQGDIGNLGFFYCEAFFPKDICNWRSSA